MVVSHRLNRAAMAGRQSRTPDGWGWLAGGLGGGTGGLAPAGGAGAARKIYFRPAYKIAGRETFPVQVVPQSALRASGIIQPLNITQPDRA